MHMLTTIDMLWLNDVLLVSPNSYTSSGHLHDRNIASMYSILMSCAPVLFFISTKHNGPLAAAQAHIDDDRYDVFNVVLLDGPIGSHKGIYMVVALLICTQSL